MALVTANRFNTLRQQIDNVLGNGSGDTGYGQTLTTQSVQVGDLINATNINKVKYCKIFARRINIRNNKKIIWLKEQ